MNDFQKALLQSVNDDYLDIPAEQEIDIPALKLKRKRTHALRIGLLVAAAVLVLVGSVFAAYMLKHPIGEVEVVTDVEEIFDFEISEDDNNRYYQLTFKELYVNADAPQKLETYFLPRKFVSAQTLDAPYCYIEKHSELAYYPFADHSEALSQEQIDQVLAATDGAHYTWDSEEYGQINFSQTVARIAADGTPFVNHCFADDKNISAEYRTFQLEEYSVFSFEITFKESDFVSRTWYWTDGDYLFSLGSSMSESQMRELFKSIVPVSTAFPYQQTFGESVVARYSENFDLLP